MPGGGPAARRREELVSRSAQVRRLVATLERASEVAVEADYSGRGEQWVLHWNNGPTTTTMRTRG